MKKNPTNRYTRKLPITKLLALSVGLSVAGLSHSVRAATIVDDHFDNGDFVNGGPFDTSGTLSNPTGIGSGWNVVNYNFNNGGVVESGSTVSLSQGSNGGQRVSMASINGASLAAGAGYSFLGLTFAQNLNNNGGPGTDRFILGVKGSSVASDPQGNADTGFYVQWESSSMTSGGNGAWNGTSILFYESASNVRTILGSWEFDTLNWDLNGVPNYTPILNLQLDLGATDWSFSITGDTQGGGAPIAFNGTYAGSGIVNELTDGYAFVYEQGEGPAITLGIDRVIITQVPEPSTLTLAGLGALAGLMALRRRGTA